MRELRAAGALAQRPHRFSRGLQPVVDLDEAALVELDARFLETDVSRVGSSTRRHEEPSITRSLPSLHCQGEAIVRSHNDMTEHSRCWPFASTFETDASCERHRTPT